MVEDILRQYDRLILVIGSANISRTSANPWTLQEREEIIRKSLPHELQERIDIVGLPDVPSDDDWVADLRKIFIKHTPLKTGAEKVFATEESSTLFTGNEWVRTLCENKGIQTIWIVPRMQISATKIREKLERGEDVSEYTIVQALPRDEEG